MLITNQIDSVYGGVNQQAAEHRNSTQVEEMINAYPTIDKGLLKRNPTQRVETTESIDIADEMWLYEYDKGLSGDNSEKFSIQIYSKDTVDMRIVNLDSGKVYTGDNGGIVFDGDSKNYLNPFIDKKGYAATTVKDTTFIVNKEVIPELKANDYSTEATPIEVDAEWRSIDIHRTTTAAVNYKRSGSNTAQAFIDGVNSVDKIAPCSYYVDARSKSASNIYFYGAYINITIDGITINVNTVNKTIKNTILGSYSTGLNFGQDGPESRDRIVTTDGIADRVKLYETFSEYRARVYSAVSSSLSSSLYKVQYADDYTSTELVPLRITRLDGTIPSISVNSIFVNTAALKNNTYNEAYYYPSTSSYFGSTYGSGQTSVTYTPSVSNIDKDGYIWIKSSNPSSPYNYVYNIKDIDGNTASANVTGTSTTAVATAMASSINSSFGTKFTAISTGSVVKVVADTCNMSLCNCSDDYGNVASFGWYRDVEYVSDLPKSLGFTGAIVNVTGGADTGSDNYWIKYDGNWKETISPTALSKVESSTMPHVLARNYDDTFTFKAYDGWKDMLVGDGDTNPIPSMFKQTEQQDIPQIKDIFFFKNRLGFVTARTVLLSEVGVYGNFWRTTVATLLDSDRIDTAIDSVKAVNIEYATYLETSVMLFSDKAQFRLKGGDILSPKNIQITQVSSYEMNTNIRPLYMNDKLFFVCRRGDSSAVMEYFISDTVDKSEANDITAHVQSYVDGDVNKLSGSPINNMLFLTSDSSKDTLFVYKYYDSGNERQQSAWFKWTFNGSLYNSFAYGRYLYLLIERSESIVVSNWILSNGVYIDSGEWIDDRRWLDADTDIVKYKQIEKMQISPIEHSSEFIDDSRYEEDLLSVDSLSIVGNYADKKIASISGFSIHLEKDITVTIDSQVSDGSFMCDITYTNGSVDTIEYVEPIVLSKQYGLFIESVGVYPKLDVDVDGSLFSISLTGSTSDSLIYNGDFSFGLYGWDVDEEWSVINGEINVGSVIPVNVNIGEWVPSIDGKKNIRGILKFKTVKITSEEDSSFDLLVSNTKRNTSRSISSKYTIDRRPMVYGDARNIKIAITNSNELGFRINTVSFEGNYTSRNRRV